jgi:hypothetical protein
MATSRVVLVALLLAVGCGSAPRPSPLAGAWRSAIQFSSGPFAAMKGLEFMYVFNAGGTLTESSNYDEAPPVPPAYGVWREVAPNQFEAKYVFYVTLLPARFEDLSGGGGWQPGGRGEFLEKIRLSVDGKSFDSELTYAGFDSTGKAAGGEFKAIGHGVRIGF